MAVRFFSLCAQTFPLSTSARKLGHTCSQVLLIIKSETLVLGLVTLQTPGGFLDQP